METPFKMKPGRSNMIKTGRSIPPTLMCNSPMKQTNDIELTKKFSTGVQDMKKARQEKNGAKRIGDVQGINVDPTSGKAESKSYEKKLERSGTKLRQLDGSGGIVKEVDWNSNSKTGGRDAEKLTRENNAKKSYTNDRRKDNKTQYNITSGSRSTNNANNREKSILVNTGKATIK